MAQEIFAENIGRLTLKPIPKDKRDSTDTVYWINKSARANKKFNPLRKTEFIIRPIVKNTFRILINGERFAEAYTAVEAPIVLERAFDHECIRSGIAEASPRFGSIEEPISTRRISEEPISPRRR